MCELLKLAQCLFLILFVAIKGLSSVDARFEFAVGRRAPKWSMPGTPVVTHYDFGVQHMLLTGLLHVDGQPVVVTLLTYLKAMISNNTLV